MEVTFEQLAANRNKCAHTIVSVRDGPEMLYLPPWWDRLYWYFAYQEFGHVSARWVLENAQSGDYLVMGAASMLSWLQRVTGSTVSHVVCIIRDPATGYLYAVQDTMHSNNVDLATRSMRGGAVVCDLYTYISEYADCYGYIYIRRLDFTDEQRRSVEKAALAIVGERINEPYNDNSLQLLSAANPWVARYLASFPFLAPLGRWLNPDNRAMFCSDLLARIYARAGILHDHPEPELYQPRDFFEPMRVNWNERPHIHPLLRIMPPPFSLRFWKARAKKVHSLVPAPPSLLSSAASAVGGAALTCATSVLNWFAPA